MTDDTEEIPAEADAEPGVPHADRQFDVIRGWHRRFCLWLEMGHGSPQSPGLMLGLYRAPGAGLHGLSDGAGAIETG